MVAFAQCAVIKGSLALVWLVHSWNNHFQGNVLKFLQIYQDVFQLIKEVELETLVTINFSPRVKNTLWILFDRVAYCCLSRRFELTNASKILHGILPELFVMWDGEIKGAIIGKRQNRSGTPTFGRKAETIKLLPYKYREWLMGTH